MKVLVINCGSSSLKYQLFDMREQGAEGTPLAAGLVERIGEGQGRLKHKAAPGQAAERETTLETPVPDHTVAMRLALDALVSPDTGVIGGLEEIDAVGHRIVHGGDYFSAPVLVDDEVERKIRDVAPLAPLHNPAHLMGISVARAMLAGIPHAVVFDTAFHQTMEPQAFLYALPYEYYEQHKVRRYGFHGTSHKYVAREAARLLQAATGREPSQANLITLHLGNGCSMAAVRAGKCVDTSMGMTPLAGVMMGTRCGDIDPAICAYLCEQLGVDARRLDTVFNKQSGLKGICGLNDMRDVHAARAKGEGRAQLAFDMFCRRIRHYLGAYLAELGRVDALVFTAGIGENDADVRAQVCAGLAPLGIAIDPAANALRSGQARDVAAADSRTRILVVPTNEELEIATETVSVVQNDARPR